MPIYGRFWVDGAARHAEIENHTAHLLDDFFGARTRTGESELLTNWQILAPVAPPKLFAIGLNYAPHAAETNKPLPTEPLMWFKAPTAVIAHGETVEVAFPQHRTDLEGELVIVIGRRGKAIAEADAAQFILGYTAGQDISDRVVQRGESQWARAKSFDTYAPLGPFIYTDLDPHALSIETRLNGEVRQSSNSREMIFSPEKIVSFISQAITLEPGDCIFTGTPEGITPLADGDVIETRIGTMAPLVNPVRFKS